MCVVAGTESDEYSLFLSVSCHWLHSHQLEYPGFEPYFGYDHIQGMMFTCTQRNPVIHIPVWMINTSIPVSDYCILFEKVPVNLYLFTMQSTAT